MFCRSGVVTDFSGPALGELAAWALSPRVGAATVDIDLGAGRRLAGLRVTGGPGGWTAASAFDPARAKWARPVTAAPDAFLVVSRQKLAAMGGFDADRFPDDGADLDLALRMQAMGASCVLFGELRATAGATDVALSRAARAAFGAADLALAAGLEPASPGAPP